MQTKEIDEYFDSTASRPNQVRTIMAAIGVKREEDKFIDASVKKLLQCRSWTEAARQMSKIGDPFERTGRHAELYKNKKLKQAVAHLIETLPTTNKDEDSIRYVLREIGIIPNKEVVVETQQKGLFRKKIIKKLERTPKTKEEILRELK